MSNSEIETLFARIDYLNILLTSVVNELCQDDEKIRDSIYLQMKDYLETLESSFPSDQPTIIEINKKLKEFKEVFNITDHI